MFTTQQTYNVLDVCGNEHKNTSVLFIWHNASGTGSVPTIYQGTSNYACLRLSLMGEKYKSAGMRWMAGWGVRFSGHFRLFSKHCWEVRHGTTWATEKSKLLLRNIPRIHTYIHAHTSNLMWSMNYEETCKRNCCTKNFTPLSKKYSFYMPRYGQLKLSTSRALRTIHAINKIISNQFSYWFNMYLDEHSHSDSKFCYCKS